LSALQVLLDFTAASEGSNRLDRLQYLFTVCTGEDVENPRGVALATASFVNWYLGPAMKQRSKIGSPFAAGRFTSEMATPPVSSTVGDEQEVVLGRYCGEHDYGKVTTISFSEWYLVAFPILLNLQKVENIFIVGYVNIYTQRV
jgi:hypothetical protein